MSVVNVEKAIRELNKVVKCLSVFKNHLHKKKIGKAHESEYKSKIIFIITFLQNTLGYDMYLQQKWAF